jgi:hypothetical protein
MAREYEEATMTILQAAASWLRGVFQALAASLRAEDFASRDLESVFQTQAANERARADARIK